MPAFAASPADAGDSDADYRFDALRDAESRHFWFRSRSRLIAWALARYFPGARSLLDVGCGTGFVLSQLAEAFPGLELSGGDLLTAGLPPGADARIRWLQMDARRIPFREEFDVVALFDTLEHIADDAAVLAEAFGALRRGGGLLVTVPQHPALWSAVDDFSGHKRRYTRAQLVGRLRDAGFELLRATSFVSLLLPALVVARLRRLPPPEELDPTAELRVPAPINAAFAVLLTLERHLIRAGLSLPAGGSLLAVARRPAA